MKKYIAILFFVPMLVHSQTADYFVGQGERYLYRKQPDSALWAFYKVLDEYPNKNQECSRAMFRIAGTYEKDSVGKSIRWYEKILASEKVNDKDKGMEVLEPFANYKHNSAVRLATLYARRKDYEMALRYIEASISTYRYITYVGPAFESRMVNIAMAQADFYKQQDMMDSAIYILVQKILDTDIKYRLPELDEKQNNDADFYSKISKTAANLIDQKYGKDQFRYSLNKALKKMKVKTDKKTKWRVCKFKLYGKVYKITSSISFYKKNNFIQDFKASKLFIELEK